MQAVNMILPDDQAAGESSQDQSASHSAKPINIQGSYVYTKEDQVHGSTGFL